MSLRLRWIDAIYRAATSTRKVRTLLTPIGVSLFGVFTASFVMAAMATDRELNLPALLPTSATLATAVPVMAAGGAIMAWSAVYFWKAKGTPVPFNPPRRVVSTGPYRFVRNPMLTGVFILLIGMGLGINSLSMLCLFTPSFILVSRWELIAIEEPELVARLGEPYVQYRCRTPMFMPSRAGIRQAAAWVADCIGKDGLVQHVLLASFAPCGLACHACAVAEDGIIKQNTQELLHYLESFDLDAQIGRRLNRHTGQRHAARSPCTAPEGHPANRPLLLVLGATSRARARGSAYR